MAQFKLVPKGTVQPGITNSTSGVNNLSDPTTTGSETIANLKAEIARLNAELDTIKKQYGATPNEAAGYMAPTKSEKENAEQRNKEYTDSITDKIGPAVDQAADTAIGQLGNNANSYLPFTGGYGYNFTGVDPNVSRKLARQTDLLNNRAYYGGVGFGGQYDNVTPRKAGEGTYRMSPVVNEETRQREMNRQLKQQQDSYLMDVNNEANTLKYNTLKKAAYDVYNNLESVYKLFGRDAVVALRSLYNSIGNNTAMNYVQQKAQIFNYYLEPSLRMQLTGIVNSMENTSAQGLAANALGAQYVSQFELLANEANDFLKKNGYPTMTVTELLDAIAYNKINMSAKQNDYNKTATEMGNKGGAKNGRYDMQQ